MNFYVFIYFYRTIATPLSNYRAFRDAFVAWHSQDLYDVCGMASLVDWRKWEREDYSTNKDLLFPFLRFLYGYLY